MSHQRRIAPHTKDDTDGYADIQNSHMPRSTSARLMGTHSTKLAAAKSARIWIDKSAGIWMGGMQYVIIYMLGFWTQSVLFESSYTPVFVSLLADTPEAVTTAPSTHQTGEPFFPRSDGLDVERGSQNIYPSLRDGQNRSRLQFATYRERRANQTQEQEFRAFRSTWASLVNANPPFVACNAPKTGCTAWFFFFAFVNNGIFFDPKIMDENPGVIHASGFLRSYSQKLDNLTAVRRVTSTHDRLVFVRNPYVRFLSSYKDWLYRHPKQKLTFKQFAAAYDAGKLNQIESKTLFDHIDPVSSFCNVANLDSLILRVEEQALWFNEVIRHYGLETTLQNYEATGNTVFESGLDQDAQLADWASTLTGHGEWPTKLFHSRHHHSSSKKLEKYYTPEIAEIVSRNLKDDFKHFGYPLWDGSKGTFRFV